MRRECLVRELLKCHVLRILPSENSTVVYLPLLALAVPEYSYFWSHFYEKNIFLFSLCSLNILAVLIYHSLERTTLFAPMSRNSNFKKSITFLQLCGLYLIRNKQYNNLKSLFMGGV